MLLLTPALLYNKDTGTQGAFLSIHWRQQHQNLGLEVDMSTVIELGPVT